MDHSPSNAQFTLLLCIRTIQRPSRVEVSGESSRHSSRLIRAVSQSSYWVPSRPANRRPRPELTIGAILGSSPPIGPPPSNPKGQGERSIQCIQLIFSSTRAAGRPYRPPDTSSSARKLPATAGSSHSPLHGSREGCLPAGATGLRLQLEDPV